MSGDARHAGAPGDYRRICGRLLLVALLVVVLLGWLFLSPLILPGANWGPASAPRSGPRPSGEGAPESVPGAEQDERHADRRDREAG